MQNFNFINFIKIVDLSLLNFIDYTNYDSSYSKDAILYSNDLNQLQINLTPKCRKLLISLILNNINNSLNYSKTNIIINTCNPSNNWRQYDGTNTVINNYKYILNDESITLDIIEFNQWINSLYKKLPTLNIKNFSTQYLSTNILKNIDTYKNNIIYLEFNELDIYDAFDLLKTYLKYNGTLNFDNLNYNIIKDGNHGYIHGSIYPDDIKENVRLQLQNKGII